MPESPQRVMDDKSVPFQSPGVLLHVQNTSVNNFDARLAVAESEIITLKDFMKNTPNSVKAMEDNIHSLRKDVERDFKELREDNEKEFKEVHQNMTDMKTSLTAQNLKMDNLLSTVTSTKKDIADALTTQKNTQNNMVNIIERYVPEWAVALVVITYFLSQLARLFGY